MSCMPLELELFDQMMVTQLKATQGSALSGGTRPCCHKGDATKKTIPLKNSMQTGFFISILHFVS
jgi:hypothetical protein